MLYQLLGYSIIFISFILNTGSPFFAGVGFSVQKKNLTEGFKQNKLFLFSFITTSSIVI